jgi:hypothetical protein
MAGQKALAVLLVMLFVHSIPTAAFSKVQASTSTDDLHRQVTFAPPTYVMGGGYSTSSGRSVESSCGAVGLQEVATLKECQSAAEEVGISIVEMVGPGRWNHVPSGCTVQQGSATPESGVVGTNGRVHFSTTPGNNNGGIGGYLLICKKAAASRIAVFSAQFGGRDRVRLKDNKNMMMMDMADAGFNRWSEASYHIGEKFEKLPDSVDAFLFTDMVNVVQTRNSLWEFVHPARQFEELCDDNILCSWKAIPNLTESQKKVQAVLASKFFKMRWIAESTHYDYIVWMDGKYLLRNPNLTQTVRKYMGESVDMLAMKHPERNTVAAELRPASERAAQLLHDDSVIQKANETYKRYVREGFSDTVGLFDSAMFIVRPARVHNMFLDWWHEVQQGVPRDQISLPWMIQKHGINVLSISEGACVVLGKQCLNPGAHL